MSVQSVSKLALGTVQFGLSYGIANRSGQIAADEAAAILGFARESGIDTLDTAIAYGASESVLGANGADRFNVITKLPPLAGSELSVTDWVSRAVRSSLERLRIEELDAILLHQPSDLLSADGAELYRALLQMKQSGYTRKIGVSIYEAGMLEHLKDFRLDLVQAPLNVFDQRVMTSGWIDRLVSQDVEVHTRSAFLQGLLLMEPARRPVQFASWDQTWQAWDQWLATHRLSPLQACLRFVLSVSGVAKIVIGVDGLHHLRAIIDAASGAFPGLPEAFPVPPPFLLNPSNWQKAS